MIRDCERVFGRMFPSPEPTLGTAQTNSIANLCSDRRGCQAIATVSRLYHQDNYIDSKFAS